MLTKSELISILCASRKYERSRNIVEELDSQDFYIVTDGHIGLNFLEQRLFYKVQNATLIHRYYFEKTKPVPDTTEGLRNSYFFIRHRCNGQHHKESNNVRCCAVAVHPENVAPLPSLKAGRVIL